MKKKKKAAKSVAITATVIILSVLLGTGLYTAYVYRHTKTWNNFIYPGVKVENIDLSGKSIQEAKNILQEKYGNAITKKKIIIKAPNKDYSIDYSKLDAKFNIDDTLNQAYSYGKDKGMFAKYKLINNPQVKQFKLKFNYNPKPIKDLISKIQEEINKQPVDGSLTMVSSGKFNVTPDKQGAKLNSDKLEKDILSKISGNVSSNEEVTAQVEILKAKHTGESLSKVNTKVASFSTDFSTSAYERSTNITLATKSINGTLLMPGDEFSFNNVVGERTAAKGYLVAGVIIGNKADSGIGGGICQVSTTLYNAILRANINSTARAHHTLPSHYIGLGMDATVDYGNLDYKFKNTLPYPIYIEGYVSNKHLYFNVYSDSSLNVKTYDIVSKTTDTLNYTTEYKDDPTLPVGQEQVSQPPSTGYKVEVYRNTYQNGTMVSQDLLYKDTYLPVNEIIQRGTKK